MRGIWRDNGWARSNGSCALKFALEEHSLHYKPFMATTDDNDHQFMHLLSRSKRLSTSVYICTLVYNSSIIPLCVCVCLYLFISVAMVTWLQLFVCHYVLGISSVCLLYFMAHVSSHLLLLLLSSFVVAAPLIQWPLVNLAISNSHSDSQLDFLLHLLLLLLRCFHGWMWKHRKRHSQVNQSLTTANRERELRALSTPFDRLPLLPHLEFFLISMAHVERFWYYVYYGAWNGRWRKRNSLFSEKKKKRKKPKLGESFPFLITADSSENLCAFSEERQRESKSTWEMAKRDSGRPLSLIHFRLWQPRNMSTRLLWI